MRMCVWMYACVCVYACETEGKCGVVGMRVDLGSAAGGVFCLCVICAREYVGFSISLR